MSVVARVGTPSLSCVAAARKRAPVGSSITVTPGAPICSPTRPANSERPFNTDSPLNALASTPRTERGDQWIEDHRDAATRDRLRAEHARRAHHRAARHGVEIEIRERATRDEAVSGLHAGAVVGDRPGRRAARCAALRRFDTERVGERGLGLRIAVARRLDVADPRDRPLSSRARARSRSGPSRRSGSTRVRRATGRAPRRAHRRRQRGRRARTTRRARRRSRCCAPRAALRRPPRGRANPPTRSPGGDPAITRTPTPSTTEVVSDSTSPPNTSTSVSRERTTYASTCSSGLPPAAMRRSISSRSLIPCSTSWLALTRLYHRRSSLVRAPSVGPTRPERSGRSVRTCRATCRSRCPPRRCHAAHRARCR